MREEATILERSLGFLKEILKDLEPHPSIFVVTDRHGVICYSQSNTKEIPPELAPWASILAGSLGRNALNQAISTGVLSVMPPSDHDSPVLKEYFSVASPFRFLEEGTHLFLGLFGTDPDGPGPATGIIRAAIRSIEGHEQIVLDLQRSEQESEFEEAIIESSHEGVVVLNAEGIITHANRKTCEILGFSRSELLGTRVAEYVDSKINVLDIFDSGKTIEDKEVFLTMRNRTLHILNTSVPVRDRSGKVVAVINNIKEIKGVHNLVNRMTGARASFTFRDIIYGSSKMAETVESAEAAAISSLPVLIQGESGTGKELFAHAIHNASSRRDGPFVIIDCAAIPRELVESELFGYVEGAFTGARKGGKTGKFELANGGSVFIDEIGELPLEIQVKFLRVLQSQTIVRVGDSQVLPLNIRVIAATNRDLGAQVGAGSFRSDLFYRLNVLSLKIPSLRERAEEDIPILTDYLLEKYEKKLQMPGRSVSPPAREMLKRYSWPGNIRELENVLARAVYISQGMITPEHLPSQVRSAAASGAFPEASAPESSAPVPEGSQMDEGKLITFAEAEKEALLRALRLFQGNKARAAEALGVSRATLYNLIRKYQLHPRGL